LRELAEDYIAPRLETLPGVASVEVSGGRVREIQVDVDRAKLEGAGLALADVVEAVRRGNVDVPAGSIKTGTRDINIRSLGRSHTVEPLGDLVIRHQKGTAIRIRDVAQVRDGFEDSRSIALVNGGAVRGGIPAGTVTLKRVMGVLPYDDPLIAMKLTGRQLSGAMENSVGELPRAAGRFLQVSGLNYLFDPAAPSGARVKQITVQRAQLQDDREYGVAVFGFIAGGGDGYSVFPQGRERVDHQVPLRDLLIAALKTGPLSAQEEGRIREAAGLRQK